MASRVFDRGLLRIGQQASESTNYNAARNIQTLSIDDSSVAFAQTDTALNTGGAVTNMFDVIFDATPTETAPATITHVATVPAPSGIFTTRRIVLHDDTTGNVTTSSTTIVCGIDGQTFTKDANFAMKFTIKLTYTSV